MGGSQMACATQPPPPPPAATAAGRLPPAPAEGLPSRLSACLISPPHEIHTSPLQLNMPPPLPRGPPRVPPGEHDYRGPSEEPYGGRDEPYNPRGGPPGRRPGLQSVVAPADERGSGSEGGRKRPAQGTLLEDNADVKRRNKRLFGAILGTLQRFRYVCWLRGLWVVWVGGRAVCFWR